MLALVSACGDDGPTGGGGPGTTGDGTDGTDGTATTTGVSSGLDGSSGSTGDPGDWLCPEPPEQGQACAPIEGSISPSFEITVPERLEWLEEAQDVPCSVFVVRSDSELDMMWHSAGLSCDFGAGLDEVVAVGHYVPVGAGHPLRLGDRLRLWLGPPSWEVQERDFVLRDESLDVVQAGGIRRIAALPPPEVLAPFAISPHFELCSFTGFEPNGCINATAPFAMDVSSGPAEVSMLDGESAVLDGLRFYTRAVEYYMCNQCGDVPPWSAALVFGARFDEPSPVGCDPLALSCPPGEECVPVSTTEGVWDATVCVPAGAAGEDEGCTPADPGVGQDECDVGLVCLPDEAEPLGGRCRPRCTGSLLAPECAADQRCQLETAGPLPPLVCVPRCDPLAQDCAEPGEGCYFVPDMGFECVTAGEAESGETCEYINDCVAGRVCVSAELVEGCPGAPGCCVAFCSLMAPACDFGECVPFFDRPPPGSEDVGACVASPA